MSSELARPVKPRPELARMASRSIKTADQASLLLPKIVARLEALLKDKEFKPSVKELTMLGSFVERLSQHRQQVAKEAGLLADRLTRPEAPQTIVNVQIRADLPLDERIKLIEAEVNGTPRIEAVRVLPEGEAVK